MYRTKEQMNEELRFCKEYDILEVAKALGYTIKRYGSIYGDKEDKSIRFYPNTNSYYDFYNSVGGTPIDLVCNYNGVTVKDAIRYILDLSGHSVYEYSAADKHTVSSHKRGKTSETAFIPPEANSNHRRVFAYLNKTRGIDADIIQRMLHEHRIYETADNHNIAFVGIDKEGVTRHVFLRGTVSDKVWRGDVAGGDKKVGFRVPGESDDLVVFEAPIDLLSYMCLRRDESPHPHMLAMGMIADPSLEAYLREYPEVKNIRFCLDNDPKGREATMKLAATYSEKGYKCYMDKVVKDMIDSRCKDVNELLQLSKGIRTKGELENDRKAVR